MENPELLKAIGNLLDEKLQPIKNQLVQLNERMDRMEEETQKLAKYCRNIIDTIVSIQEQDMKIQAAIEVKLVPSFSTIESCYLDTYKRYQDGIEKMKELETDVIVLKQTVHNHSLKLMMIS